MRNFIVILLLLGVQCAYGQQGFIKAYNIGGNGTLFNNILLEEDTLIVCGISISDTFPFEQGIVFAKLDTNGIIQDYKVHTDSAGSSYSWSNEFFGMTRVADGSGYVLLGHVFQRSNGIAMKLDRDGEMIWLKEYEDNNSLQDFHKKIIEVEEVF